MPSLLLLALCGGDRSSMPADATAGSIAEKEYIRGLLQQIDGVVSGLKTSLPDFSHAQPSGQSFFAVLALGWLRFPLARIYITSKLLNGFFGCL